jgi:hypothetical protein
MKCAYAPKRVSWKDVFDQYETKELYGIATLFGEREQCLYPCSEEYQHWRKLCYFCLLSIGLDQYCVSCIIEELDEDGFFYCAFD